MRFLNWLEDRTGWVEEVRRIGALSRGRRSSWLNVWGKALGFAVVTQAVTGVLMMTVYSPSTTTAWSSVWYLQTQMPAGWLIRGLHHFGSHAVVVLVVVFLWAQVWLRAYRAPREIIWWLALAVAVLIPAACVTGWLLPYDQKGYWATRVPTHILGLTPGMGAELRALLLGGADYGHATLTRFFTLHVWILPFTLALIGWTRFKLILRQRRREPAQAASALRETSKNPTASTPQAQAPNDARGWPTNLLREGVIYVVYLAILMGLSYYAHVHEDILLDAPADPSASDYPARPEWYFLFLFQFLKHFEGATLEVVGALVIPGAALAFFLLAPAIAKVGRKVGEGLILLVASALTLGAGGLTLLALRDDRVPPPPVVAALQEKQRLGQPLGDEERRAARALEFDARRRHAREVAKQALAAVEDEGIPPAGPLALMRATPSIQGPRLFAAHCASCHRFDGHDGTGKIPFEPATSSDLKGFGSRDWIRSLLENPGADRHFGLMTKQDGDPAHTRMIKWREEQLELLTDEESRRQFDAKLDAAAAYLAYESEHPGKLAEIVDEESAAGAAETIDVLVLQGRLYFMEECNRCHSYQGERGGTVRAPEMLGYGSVEWIEKMIADPSDATRYHDKGREPAQMPAFQETTSQSERELLARWLRSSQAEPSGR